VRQAGGGCRAVWASDAYTVAVLRMFGDQGQAPAPAEVKEFQRLADVSGCGDWRRWRALSADVVFAGPISFQGAASASACAAGVVGLGRCCRVLLLTTAVIPVPTWALPHSQDTPSGSISTLGPALQPSSVSRSGTGRIADQHRNRLQPVSLYLHMYVE